MEGTAPISATSQKKLQSTTEIAYSYAFTLFVSRASSLQNVQSFALYTQGAGHDTKGFT